MNELIGDVFPIAFGIAASPIPISAVVLLMLGKKPLRNGVMFVVGWILGVGLPAALTAAAVGSVVQKVPAHLHPALFGTLLLLLGLVCWFFAWRVFRTRPREGQQAGEPHWMTSLADAGPVRALALGLALSLLNPEDLMLSLSGGAVIGGAHMTWQTSAVVLAVFTLIGSLTVIAPPLIYAIGRDRAAGALKRSKEWLVQNNAVLTALLLFLIGAVVVGHGIKAF